MNPIKLELSNGDILHGYLVSAPGENNNLNWQIRVCENSTENKKIISVRDEEVLEADVLQK